ncbi:Neurofibromin [Manis javanica]|nr:Neurofibromin [Manis javanica]
MHLLSGYKHEAILFQKKKFHLLAVYLQRLKRRDSQGRRRNGGSCLMAARVCDCTQHGRVNTSRLQHRMLKLMEKRMDNIRIMTISLYEIKPSPYSTKQYSIWNTPEGQKESR